MHARTPTTAIAQHWLPAGLVALGTPALATATLVGQARFARHRKLPFLDGLDASGFDGPPDAPPLHVVAIGDSTLTGPGLGAPEQVWLRQALAGVATHHRVKVTSLAVSGSRIVDVLDHQVVEAISLAPDMVVVAAGGNDVVQRTTGAAAELTTDRLLATLCDSVPVVAMTRLGNVGVVPRAPQPLRRLLGVKSALLSKRIDRGMAQHPEVIAIETAEATDRLGEGLHMFTADLFHPSAEGHAVWASAATPALTEALARLGEAQPARSRFV